MPLPEPEKQLLREQLDKHTIFTGTISMADKIDLMDMELEQIAYDAALQHRGNFYSNRRGRTIEEYRTRHGLGDILGNMDNGTEPITTQEMIAVYMENHPASLLIGNELEVAAAVECMNEKDSIDIEINDAIIGNGNALLSIEQGKIKAFNDTKVGIRDKLSNLKRAVIIASWK